MKDDVLAAELGQEPWAQARNRWEADILVLNSACPGFLAWLFSDVANSGPLEEGTVSPFMSRQTVVTTLF